MTQNFGVTRGCTRRKGAKISLNKFCWSWKCSVYNDIHILLKVVAGEFFVRTGPLYIFSLSNLLLFSCHLYSRQKGRPLFSANQNLGEENGIFSLYKLIFSTFLSTPNWSVIFCQPVFFRRDVWLVKKNDIRKWHHADIRWGCLEKSQIFV